MSLFPILVLAAGALGAERGTATVSPAELVVPDPWRAPTAAALTPEQRAACTDAAALVPGGPGLKAAVVEVRTDGLHYAGTQVAPITDGAIAPEHLNDGRIQPLFERVARTRDDLQILGAWGCTTPSVATPRVLVAADGSLPYGLVRSVLATVGAAGISHVDLRVATATPAPEARILTDGPNAAVQLTAAGTTIQGLGDPIPLSGHDPKMLRTVIDRLKPNAAGQNRLVLQATDDLPWSMVVDTLGTVAFDARDRPLLPATVLAGIPAPEDAPDAPAGRPGLPDPVLPASAPVFRTQLPALDDPTAPAGHPLIRSSVSRKPLDKVVRKDLHEIRYCYDKAKTRDAGTVVVGFQIGADGKATNVALLPESTLGNKAVTDCIVGRFQGLVFTPVDGLGSTPVHYALDFPQGE